MLVELLKKKIYDSHSIYFHCNEKDLFDLFKNFKIWFYYLALLIQEYVNNCPICVITNETIHRQEPKTSIIVKGLYVKYKFDRTYMNNEFINVYGVKYIFGIIMFFPEKQRYINIIIRKFRTFFWNKNILFK